jgi:signal transduction histidine kinase
MSNSTGLGLAIVKKILDLHQSSIKVFSEVNRGTTFEFALPVYQA